jgi:hypothetical protein
MLSSDGFDYDDDAEMEDNESQDAEGEVLNDEVCVRPVFLDFFPGSYLVAAV